MVASLGPLLETVIEYVTVSPSVGVELSTDFIVTKFAALTTINSSKSSKVIFVSSWSCELLIVFFKIWPTVPKSTVTVIKILSVWPAIKFGIDHIDPFQLPVVGSADT